MRIDHHCSEEWSLDDRCDTNCICKRFRSETSLLVSDQLPNLLRTIRAYSNQSDQEISETSFSVNIFSNPFEKTVEWPANPQTNLPSVSPRARLLLDPFTLLYGLKSLEIKGAVNEEYKRSVVSSARQPEPTAASIITAALAMKTQGDEAFYQGQYNRSLSLYRLAIGEVRVNHRPGRYTGTLNAIEFAGMSTEHAVGLFIIRLHSQLAAALVKMGDYERALEYAYDSLHDAEDGPYEDLDTDHECGTAHYWLGLSSEGLGDVTDALEEMEEALQYVPSNADFKKEHKRLKAKKLEIDTRLRWIHRPRARLGMW